MFEPPRDFENTLLSPDTPIAQFSQQLFKYWFLLSYQAQRVVKSLLPPSLCPQDFAYPIYAHLLNDEWRAQRVRQQLGMLKKRYANLSEKRRELARRLRGTAISADELSVACGLVMNRLILKQLPEQYLLYFFIERGEDYEALQFLWEYLEMFKKKIVFS